MSRTFPYVARPVKLDPGLFFLSRDWKWKSKKNKKNRYSIRVHRNYLDARFDPVFWLLSWLAFSGITSGPIFQHLNQDVVTGNALNESQWVSMTQRLFTQASSQHTPLLFDLSSLYAPLPFLQTGLYTPADKTTNTKAAGCTNHAIRKSSVQWAGRCLGAALDAKNNGRWKTFDIMALYHAQGSARREKLCENGGKDPIFGMWVWKSVTVASLDGRDQM